ncbi:DUF2254 domain-containing protein [Microbacterium hominis]|uniref:DUF2254 domain-containing protein n=1 Tax=Microbacterium hominis TaxID=162426 RepID=A0A7D4PSP8_9MICO|nr:DUF2254 domain-containing protein [Microbacterium hominis]QKJ18213.1 DUF2254 domain-containing protein [Microbacterium hominis]
MTGQDGAMRRRFAVLSEAVASRLWPVPLVAIIAAVILGIALPVLDRALDPSIPDGLSRLLFSGGVDAARAVLSAIAGSLITAASLTFSLTVVALQLASSQASPRLLRMFSADPMVHATLALFLGTFSFSLTVLRTVEDATDQAAAFVPRIALTTASLLTLASVVLLVFFLAHLARELRVETMMRDVHREASQTIRLLADDRPGRPVAAPATPSDARLVRAPSSGFLTGVDRHALMETAVAHDVVVRELRPVGANIVEGAPLAQWWPAAGAASADAERAGIDARILDAFSAAYERTPSQDIGFGLRQLGDVAAKALSPGVNDPTTAVHALGHITALLGDLAEIDEPPAAWGDDDGRPRLIPAGDTFDDLVEVGLQQVRRYGAGDADVAERLLRAVDDLGWRLHRPGQRAVLTAQLHRIEASIARADYDDTERERYARLAERARASLSAR